MKNMIENNPAFAAAFYFVLTWAGFPIAALISSQVRGISFEVAASTPYILFTFVFGSIIAAFQMYVRTKRSL